MKCVVAMVVALLCSATTGYAQEADAATETQAAAVMVVAPEWEAAATQQWSAHVLYVVSAILGGTGTALAVFGTLEIQRGGGPELVVVGAAINLAHVVMTVVGACLDFGSASHRRKLLRAHPELHVELAPGPGDAGLGLALHF